LLHKINAILTWLCLNVTVKGTKNDFMEISLKITIQSKLLLLGASIAFCAAIWHLLCIYGGPTWFEFARAPKEVIDSARQGTWLATVGSVCIAALMFTCSLYALSATNVIRQLPLLKTGLIVISSLCLIRGVIVIPYFMQFGFDMWEFIAAIVWFFVGLCYLIGAIERIKNNVRKESNSV